MRGKVKVTASGGLPTERWLTEHDTRKDNIEGQPTTELLSLDNPHTTSIDDLKGKDITSIKIHKFLPSFQAFACSWT